MKFFIRHPPNFLNNKFAAKRTRREPGGVDGSSAVRGYGWGRCRWWLQPPQSAQAETPHSSCPQPRAQGRLAQPAPAANVNSLLMIACSDDPHIENDLYILIVISHSLSAASAFIIFITYRCYAILILFVVWVVCDIFLLVCSAIWGFQFSLFCECNFLIHIIEIYFEDSNAESNLVNLN